MPPPPRFACRTGLRQADGALQEFEEVDRMVCQIAMSQAEASHGVVHLFGGGAVTISWAPGGPYGAGGWCPVEDRLARTANGTAMGRPRMGPRLERGWV